MTAIRDARPSDRDAILAVTLGAYEQYGAALTPPRWAMYRQNIQATLADVQPAAQIVAEEGGALVGTVLLYPGGAVMANRRGKPVTLEGRRCVSSRWRRRRGGRAWRADSWTNASSGRARPALPR